MQVLRTARRKRKLRRTLNDEELSLLETYDQAKQKKSEAQRRKALFPKSRLLRDLYGWKRQGDENCRKSFQRHKAVVAAFAIHDWWFKPRRVHEPQGGRGARFGQTATGLAVKTGAFVAVGGLFVVGAWPLALGAGFLAVQMSRRFSASHIGESCIDVAGDVYSEVKERRTQSNDSPRQYVWVKRFRAGGIRKDGTRFKASEGASYRVRVPR
jgi:hypothetical protein